MIKTILGHYMSSGGRASIHPSWENSTFEWPHFGLNLYRRLECYQWYLTETGDVGMNTICSYVSIVGKKPKIRNNCRVMMLPAL